MGRIKLVWFLLIMASGAAEAQVNRYMVFFTNKTGTPHTTGNPETFLSERAIQRRSNQNIPVISEDLPVTPSYIQDVKNAGATVLYNTKWMNGVLVECDASLVSTLEGLSCVSSVELVAPEGRPAPESGRISSSRKSNKVTSETDVELSMIGINVMHEAGYRGEGMLIAVMDSGFPGADTISFFKHVFDEERFDAASSHDFVSGGSGSSVFRHYEHGTKVWSAMAAYKQDQFVGGAYKATYILFVTEYYPTEYRIEEYNWLFAAERADSAGVDVINVSLGYTTFDDPQMDYSPSQMDGETAVITRAAQIASGKGMIIVTSAGNAGGSTPTTISAPADAENVLTVGAVTAAGVRATISSVGPSADGRIKPDIAALGSLVSVIEPDGTTSTATGTSLSSPLIASLVADVWQMLPDLTAQEVMDTIRSRASQASNPDNLLGYGIPDFSFVVTSNDPEILNEPVNVFPNPSSGLVFIQLPVSMQGELRMRLIDAKGAEYPVNISRISDQEFSIDMSGKKPGLYVLCVRHGRHITTHKIIRNP